MQKNVFYPYAEALAAETREIYRTLHRRPECKNGEIETNRILRGFLTEWGIPFLAPKDNMTLALLNSGKAGGCTGVRCDTDALPVEEATGLPFASQNPGVMHACGHDGHMAIGLTAARILHEHPECWRGTAKIIFQPAEEGGGGAAQFIDTGTVGDCTMFFGLHLWSANPSGELSVSPGAVSAAVNMFSIDILGRGGHGATPEICRDALLCAGATALNLQSIVSRRVNPMEPALLTLGRMQAGSTGNVIAGSAHLEGTHRAFSEETRKVIEESLKQIAAETARAYGCEAQVTDRRISGVVVNHPTAAALALESAQTLAEPARIAAEVPMLLGDDFADYGAIAPSVYVRLGIADPQKGTDKAHHAPDFKIDEDVLPLGVAWTADFVSRANAAVKG